MKIAGIDFPEEILDALHEGNLVVFAGAGVSKAAGLPDFKELSEQIAEGSSQKQGDGETEDQFLGRLKHSEVDVHKIAAQILKDHPRGDTDFHKDLIHLYPDDKPVRIVTTNFDLLFEQAVSDRDIEIFQAPALPLGDKFNGIVHVHGSIDHPDRMVLTDKDFGRAYLTRKWALRFLVDLFRQNIVLFVGYGHNDTIIKYLAQALTEEKIQRFAFIGDKEISEEKWRNLNIKTILFPQSTLEDYSLLYKAVKNIVDVVRREPSDWRRKIKEIVERKSPKSDEDYTELHYAMKYKRMESVGFFTDAARDPAWIEWLNAGKYLDNLFIDGSSEERNDKQDEDLSFWLARYFIREHSDNLFRLIAKHGRKLHPIFLYMLIFNIVSEDQPPLDKATLSRWVSVLLRTAPETISQSECGQILFDLGGCCIKHQLWDDLLHIFNFLSRNSLNIDENLLWNQSPDVPMSRMPTEVLLIRDHYSLDRFWNAYLQPNLDRVAESVLEKHVSRWEEMHSTLLGWGETNERWDPLSSPRYAIEPHDQNLDSESFDVLIDAMRDSLEWLIKNKTQIAEQWCVRLARSASPLLRRLAVHGISKRKDLSADDKIDWWLNHVHFHEIHIRYEIFHSIELAYPDASKDYRERVIAEIKKYQSSDEDEQDAQTAQKHFDWLTCLSQDTPDCLLLKHALDNIREKHPEFESSFSSDNESEDQFITEQSPWSVGELLSKPAAGQIDYLLNYKDEGPVDDGSLDIVSRKGLLEEITKAITKDFGWGIGLADALSEAEESSTDLWGSLMHAWTEMDLDEDKYKQILPWLAYTKLKSNHNQGVANVLYSLVKDGGKPYAITMLPQAEEVANGLWENLKPGDINENLGDWVLREINHPAGKLAEFWLGAISVWRGKQEPSPDELPDNYRKGLSKIVGDQTLHGRLGRTILASQLHFFSNIDKAWTKKYLFPLFDTNDPDEDYQAVWDGFLTWGRITPVVAEELEEYFLKAVENLGNTFANTQQNRSRQNRFIKYYATMINFFVSDPFPEWIPKIFQYGDDNIGHIFAHQVWLILRNLEGEHQERCWEKWLKDYWENRLVGKPKSLRPEEIGRMIEWLPHLTEVFPEAVELAVQMPSGSLDHCQIVHELNESNLWKRYPKDVSELLVYLEESKLQGYIFWDELPELVGKLRQQDISEKHKEGLKELLVKLGFPDQ